MSLDSDLLRSIRVRWRFKTRIVGLPLYIFEQPTRFLITEISAYFKAFKDCEEIDKETFLTWLFERKGDKFSEADKILYNALMASFDRPLTEEAELFLTQRINDSDAVYRMMDLTERFTNGEEVEVDEEIRYIADLHRAARRDSEDDDGEVISSVEDIIARAGADSGLHWPLACQNDVMRPAQGGDNIIVAARPESGKTSFLALHAVCFAGQIPQLEPDSGRCVLWLNNEGPGERVKLRLWQCALKATLSELTEFINQGTINDVYGKVVKDGTIRIFDIHGWNTAKVERLIERVRPAVIIWDMADHVRYTGEGKSQAARTDEYLEGLYNLIREIGVRYDAVNLISSQLSGDAENVPYPSLGMLKDSKTGKQGTADAIITLGFVDIKPTTRYIGLTKNKLNKGTAKGNTRKLGEIAFDGARGHFYIPSEVDNE